MSAQFDDAMLSLGLARVAEEAALACRPLIGRGDEKAADQARPRLRQPYRQRVMN